MDHVAVDAATGTVVQHDVASLADQMINTAVDRRIAGGLVIGSPRMRRHHARAGVVATMNIVGDLVGLRGQIGLWLLLAMPPVGAMVTITFDVSNSVSIISATGERIVGGRRLSANCNQRIGVTR